MRSQDDRVPEDIRIEINRHLLIVQQWFRSTAAERPQPLAVEEAEETLLALADLVRDVRADVELLCQAAGSGTRPSDAPTDAKATVRKAQREWTDAAR